MSDVLIVENNIVNILEIDESEILVIEDRSVELLTIGEQGPEGIPGQDSDPATQLVFISDTEPAAPNGLWIRTGLDPNGEGVDLVLMETT